MRCSSASFTTLLLIGVASLMAAPAELRTLDARKTNLSKHPTPFVGREADLAALHALFERGDRLVTLMGPGGTGKTRLSMRYAAVHMNSFCNDGGGGVWFVDLTEARRGVFSTQ